MNQNASSTTGPIIAEHDGLVDLSTFAFRAGLGSAVYTTQALSDLVLVRTWEPASEQWDANKWALIKSFLAGLDKLLADEERSQFASFTFKHWYRPEKTSTKDHRVRVQGQLYQTQEAEVWVQLKIAPVRP